MLSQVTRRTRDTRMTGGNHPGCQAKLAGKGSRQHGTWKKKVIQIFPVPKGGCFGTNAFSSTPFPNPVGTFPVFA